MYGAKLINNIKYNIMKQTQSQVAITINNKLENNFKLFKNDLLERTESILLPKGEFLNRFDPLTES